MSSTSAEGATAGAAGATGAAAGSEVARTTGRGFLVITSAKAWFLVTGAVVSLALPTLFDMRADQGTGAFGDFGVVINLVSIFNMVMITGTLQAVSKIVSEVPSQARLVVRRALAVQLWVGVPIAVLYAVGTPVWTWAFKDPDLAAPIAVSSGVVLMYSVYAVFVGFFNGTKRFTRQALLDIGFATLKSVLMLGAVLLGLSVVGAVGGFVATAITMTGVAWIWYRRSLGDGGELTEDAAAVRERGRRILGYMLAIMAYTFFLNGIIRADLFLLKTIAALRFEDLGMAAGLASDEASKLTGVYSGMANIARLPYQAVIAITFVVFPIVSRATFEGDREAARGYIRSTLRYSTILIAGMAAVLVADRATLLAGLYPDAYGTGVDALMWLALGMVAFALTYVATTILISAGRPVASLVLAAGTLVATVGANAAFLLSGDVGEGMLARAGLATLVATVAGLVAVLAYIGRRFGASVPLWTALRTVAAAAAVIGLAPFVPIESLADLFGGGRLVTLAAVGLKMALFMVFFYGLLVAMREFGRDDLARLKSVLRRRAKPPREA